jgi:hypothetical protein
MIAIIHASDITQIIKTVDSILQGTYRPPVVVLDTTGVFNDSRVEVYKTSCVVSDTGAYAWASREYPNDDLAFVREGIIVGKRVLSKLADCESTAELVSFTVPDTWAGFMVRPSLFAKIGSFDSDCCVIDFGHRAYLNRVSQHIFPLSKADYSQLSIRVKLAFLAKWGTLPTDLDSATRTPFENSKYHDELVGCFDSNEGHRLQLLSNGRVGVGNEYDRRFWSARDGLLLFFGDKEVRQVFVKRGSDGEALWTYNDIVLEVTSGLNI